MINNDAFRLEVKNAYDKNSYAEEYRERELLDFEKMMFYDALHRLNPNPTILDLGCGSGFPYDTYFSGQGLSLTGIDFSDKQIALARKNNPTATYIAEDISHFETNQKFDLVLALFSILHIPRSEQKALFEKIHSFLNDGGVFLFTISDKPEGELIQREFTGENMLWSYFDYATYISMLEEVGFKVEVSKNQSDYGLEPHNWVILRKQKSPQ